MRPISTAIQLCPSPAQFQHATPHRGVPFSNACPGHLKPQPAGRTKPCSATHWRALAQRSAAVKLPGRATGAGAGFVVGGEVAGVVTGATGRGLAVVVTGFGLTVVDVDVDVDVGAVVLDVDGGGASVVSGAGVAVAEADASAVHQTNVAPAMATTASTAATL